VTLRQLARIRHGAPTDGQNQLWESPSEFARHRIDRKTSEFFGLKLSKSRCLKRKGNQLPGVLDKPTGCTAFGFVDATENWQCRYLAKAGTGTEKR
jgi:hypothetical protein